MAEIAKPATPGAAESSAPDPRATSTVAVGAIAVLVTALSLILLQALFYKTAATEELRKAVGRSQEVRQLQAEQQHRLEGYHWVDREHGVVAIPIERAMELVVRDQGAW